jgi:hypothetical protein
VKSGGRLEISMAYRVKVTRIYFIQGIGGTMAKIRRGTIPGPYYTDCNCKCHFFPDIRSAYMHCDNCSIATTVVYLSPYSKDKIVYTKADGFN